MAERPREGGYSVAVRSVLAAAADHEVGHVPERVALGPRGERVERFRRGVVEADGPLPGTLGPLARADDAEELADLALRLAGRDDAAREVAAPPVAVERGVDHRERGHALGQVAPDALAEVSLVSNEVEDVVRDLKREAEVRAERAERGDVLRVGLGEKRGTLAARGVERRGLDLDP